MITNTTNTDARAGTMLEQPPVLELTLNHPFTNAAGVKIERIALRRARRSDLRAAAQYSKDDFDQETFLFARLSGLTMEDLDNLDLEDNARLVQRFRAQLGTPPAQP